MKELAGKFMRLFAGLDRAYGTYDLSAPTHLKSGKMTGQGLTRKKPVTSALWEKHLSGEGTGLGIVPIRDDETAMFGAVDIDGRDGFYVDFDLKSMVKRVKDLGLPLCPCRSKSGGLHLYLFAVEPVSAADMIARLREIRSMLDLAPDTEIFPKQVSIQAARGDVGGWINMPYADVKNTSRYGLSLDGEPLSAEDYIAWSEARRQTKEFFTTPISHATSADAWFPDGPPCLQRLSLIKIGEGGRSNGLVSIATYLRKAFPDDWRDKAREYARFMFTSPLEDKEIRSTLGSAAKGYQYMCDKEPLIAHCDGAICRARRFGVGRDGPTKSTEKEGGVEVEDAPPSFPILGQLRMLMTEPPVWFLDVDDRSVELTTEQLQSPRMFQACVMSSCRRMIPLPTATSWQRMVDDMMSRVVLIEAPEESSPGGILWEYVERFCSKSPAKDRDEILNGRPWSDDGMIWFKMYHLMIFLNTNHFKDMKQREITVIMRKKGCLSKALKIRGRNYNVWGVPEFAKLEAREIDEKDEKVF